MHDLHFSGTAPSGRFEDFHGVHLIFAGSVADGVEPRVVEVDGTTDAVAGARRRHRVGRRAGARGRAARAGHTGTMTETVFTYASPALSLVPGPLAEIRVRPLVRYDARRVLLVTDPGWPRPAIRPHRRADERGWPRRDDVRPGARGADRRLESREAVGCARVGRAVRCDRRRGGWEQHRHRQGGQPADDQRGGALRVPQRTRGRRALRRRSRCCLSWPCRPPPGPAASRPRSACSTCCRSR